MNRLHNAGLHIKNSGASCLVAFHRKWARRESAFRENRVVVADNQNFRSSAPHPMNMRARD